MLLKLFLGEAQLMHYLTPLLPFAFGGSLLFFTVDLTQLAWVNGAA
jgi:hypothetical protein